MTPVTAQQPIYFSGAANLTGKVQVWRVGNDGTGLTRVTSLTDDVGDFSHDLGHTLVVLHRDGSRDTISSMNTDGTAPTTIATAPKGRFQSVSISPDGRSVAVAEGSSIALVEPSRLRVIGTVPSGSPVGGLTWSPDGRALAFHVIQLPGIVYAVGTLDVASGAFGPGIAPGHQPTWSPDGAHIAATWNLRISSTNGISLPVTVSDVAWSPDGSWFANFNVRSPEVRKIRIDGSGDTLVAKVSDPDNVLVSADTSTHVDWGYPLPIAGSAHP